MLLFLPFSNTDLKILQTEAPAWQLSLHHICCLHCRWSVVTVSGGGCKEDLSALLTGLWEIRKDELSTLDIVENLICVVIGKYT